MFKPSLTDNNGVHLKPHIDVNRNILFVLVFLMLYSGLGIMQGILKQESNDFFSFSVRVILPDTLIELTNHS